MRSAPELQPDEHKDNQVEQKNILPTGCRSLPREWIPPLQDEVPGNYSLRLQSHGSEKLAGQPRRREAEVEQEQAGLLTPGLRNITIFCTAGDPAPSVGAIVQPNDGIGHLPDYVARIPKCCARKGVKKGLTSGASSAGNICAL